MNSTIDLGDSDLDKTVASDPRPAPPAHMTAPIHQTSHAPVARFIPGAMITDRYRIVGILGRGGMGEVYRADDLKLGQPVALKFLPVGLEQNQGLLVRFMNEVRTALKVTHANVCRVYDIGEFEGQQFLSMEYVDGEDLASLLRRVGRLPQDRAVEVARQICAGLAAAHDQGILHRDLKPANVMIDGRGQARLTDFGLAAIAEEIDESEVNSGTPAYMAPEQIAGREVTVRSDIYALGLILYELFTGRPTFKADTVMEMQQMHSSAAPSQLTNFVSDLDPAIERAVMRCLAKDPAERPVSAIAVSASLPGGDPLAAALAAGETPSPELVAESGAKQGMAIQRALLMAVMAIVLICGGTRWAGTMSVSNFLPLDRRPEVMEDRAQTIIEELGYTEDAYTKPVDSAWGLIVWNTVLSEVAAIDSTTTDWNQLKERPDSYSYWYRQSPNVLMPNPFSAPIFLRGAVSMTNPPLAAAGEITILLDADGLLRRVDAMPPRFSLADTVGEPDWSLLFEMAGLEMDRFTPDRPRYARFQSPDRKASWVGTHADRPEIELRVDAGSYEGRVILFNVATTAGLRNLSGTPEIQPYTFLNAILDSLQPVLILLIVIFAATLGSRNIKKGRADQRGAVRFGTMNLVLFIVANAMFSHVMGTRNWSDEIWTIIVGACFIGLASWSLYSAAEPTGRQVWPTMFVSSSRLLSRRKTNFFDPLIGQSVLIGLIFGGLAYLLRLPFYYTIKKMVTGEFAFPFRIDTSLLSGQRMAIGEVLDQALALTFYFVLVMALILIRKWIKNLPISLAVAVLFWAIANGERTVESIVLNFGISAIMMFVLLRWGVVSFLVAEVAYSLCFKAASPDWSAWYSQGPNTILVSLGLLAVYGTWAAVGQRNEHA